MIAPSSYLNRIGGRLRRPPSLPLLILLCNRIRRHLNRHTIARGRITGTLRWCHQIIGDRAYQALNPIPAGRVAVCMELLLALAIINVEHILLALEAIIYLGIRNMYQLQHLQTRARTGLWINTGLRLHRVRSFHQSDSHTPDIYGYPLGRSIWMQGLI